MFTYYNEIETLYPTDRITEPSGYVKERLVAVADMLRRGCRGDAIAAQVDFAIEAIDSWEAHMGRPRVIRGWEGL